MAGEHDSRLERGLDDWQAGRMHPCDFSKLMQQHYAGSPREAEVLGSLDAYMEGNPEVNKWETLNTSDKVLILREMSDRADVAGIRRILGARDHGTSVGVEPFFDIRTRSRGDDERNTPEIGNALKSLFDPHPSKASDLVAHLAKLPRGRLLIDDLNCIRGVLGLGPFGRTRGDEPPGEGTPTPGG